MNDAIKKETIEAFNLMWDELPHVVFLLKKSREVIAVNKTAKAYGINPGIKCYELTGKTKVCDACKANAALKECTAMRHTGYEEKVGMVMDTYWLPIAGEKDLYVHFSIDITEFAKPEMFPE
jgi:hypothetical protein